MIQNIK